MPEVNFMKDRNSHEQSTTSIKTQSQSEKPTILKHYNTRNNKLVDANLLRQKLSKTNKEMNYSKTPDLQGQMPASNHR